MKPNYLHYHIKRDGTVIDTIKCVEIHRTRRVDGHYYAQIKLESGNTSGRKLATLVAEIYVPRGTNARAVWFKDGNKANIDPDNLEWLTLKESGIRTSKHPNRRASPELTALSAYIRWR